MTIRLILPICNSNYQNKGWYCEDAFRKIKYRLMILNKAMFFKSNSINLMITSNNFFGFNKYYEKRLKNILSLLSRKTHLLVGVDYPFKRNPINGIPAKIYYFHNYRDSYIKKTSIWETFPCKSRPYVRFRLQNKNRIIKLKNKSITILSCGDILSECSKNILPDTDICVDLAHMSYYPTPIHIISATPHAT